MLTHANILANVASAREALPIAVGERLFSLLPLSHMMEQTAGLLAALAAGATVYYATSRRSSAILAAFQRHQIGLLVCVPEVLALLLAGIEREVDRTGRRRVWDALNAAAARLPMAARPALFASVHRRLGGHFRMALCGGAPLAAEVQAAWERLGVRVIQGYGATECSPIIASNRYDRRVPNSVGWPLPNVEVRLASDGEVLVRGPSVTPGYRNDPAATAASFEDGWYRTGDLGEYLGLTPRPALRLRGRKKEMIVLSDGRNVFPEDVEPILRADPVVKECAVVGRPRAWPVRALRACLQGVLLFPLLRRVCRPLTVEGQAHLASLRGPALLIANHASHLDSLTVLAALPEGRRRRIAVAAAADYFFTDQKRALVASLALGAFPFHRTGPVAASLAHCGDLADGGHCLLVFPEGTRSTDGTIAPFKPGIGLLTRELGLPVVPIYLDGLYSVLPKGRTMPHPGSVRVVIGAPLRVDPSLTNAEAAARLEAALRALASHQRAPA